MSSARRTSFTKLASMAEMAAMSNSGTGTTLAAMPSTMTC